MTGAIEKPQKYRSSPKQPIDRHLSEVGEKDGTIYLNAGIDSTCAKKRSRTMYKLTDGIVMSISEMQSPALNHEQLSSILLNSSTYDNQVDMINSSSCIYCGRGNKISKDK